MKVLVLLLAFIACIFGERVHSEFNSVLNSLKNYQVDSGAFRLRRGQPATLEATYHALLLSSIHGLQDKFNTSDTLRFIQKLENSDGGYGKEVGSASDLESTRYALLGLHHLNQQIPNPTNVANFLQKLYEKDAHLFTLRSGEKPSLKATLYALQVFELLKDDKFVKAHSTAILDEVKKNIKEESFVSKESGSPSTINYYGVVLALKLGHKFQNSDAWAHKIGARQLEDGGFGSVEATFHAVASLHALQTSEGAHSVSGLNKQKLGEYVKKTSTDLRSASLGHATVLLANGLESFTFSSSYDTTPAGGYVDNRIVQGSKVRPVLSIFSAGHPVSGLKVSLSSSFNNEKAKTEVMNFKPETKSYRSTDVFDSSDKLGPISFVYTVTWNLPELGHVEFSHKDEGTVGYGITVVSDAKLEGKELEEGSAVGVGTTFDFKVTLNTQSEAKIQSGDFEFIFSVVDSSQSVIHQSKVDGKTNKNPLSFSYELKTADVPSGDLNFLFQVKKGDQIHTTKKVTYSLSIPMIATEIQLSQTKYKIGDKVEVSFTPANFPDLRSVVGLNEHDANKRNFNLVLSTVLGSRLLTVPGHPKTSSGKTSFTFSFTIPKTFDLIGTNLVSFQYKPAHGSEIDLLNFDSKIGELYEESNPLNFTVQAELFMHAIKEKISKEEFYYGHEITFKFQVKDGLSNNIIFAGQHELANVFLSLKHQAKTRTITSTNQTATHYLSSSGEVEGFLIKWIINPNAIGGKSSLSISAADPDGKPITIFKDQSRKEEATFKVTIGGTIDSKHKTFVNSDDDEKTVFAVEFNLFCQGHSLKNAQLRSTVFFQADGSQDKQKVFDAPVAVNDQLGGYEVSWVLENSKVTQSGSYLVEFFREADRSKTDEPVQPLVVIAVPYQAPSKPLPFRTEFVVVLLLALAFFSVSSQKQKYATN